MGISIAMVTGESVQKYINNWAAEIIPKTV
jgi:hypothetical protein